LWGKKHDEGKPWHGENKLKDWFITVTTDLSVLTFSFEGSNSKEAIRQKLIKFGLMKEQQQTKNLECCCSIKLDLL
jgi:hypothetical protein